MKKILVVACIIAMAAAADVYASPAVDGYIQALENLASPRSMIPKAPKGYGAVRDEKTGDFLVLVPKEYCGKNGPGYVVTLGYTIYGGEIAGYCVEF